MDFAPSSPSKSEDLHVWLLQLASVLVRYHLDLLPDRCCPSLEVSITNGAVKVHR